jgi:hypothetical protein
MVGLLASSVVSMGWLVQGHPTDSKGRWMTYSVCGVALGEFRRKYSAFLTYDGVVSLSCKAAQVSSPYRPQGHVL